MEKQKTETILDTDPKFSFGVIKTKWKTVKEFFLPSAPKTALFESDQLVVIPHFLELVINDFY